MDEPTEARLYQLVRERLSMTTLFSVGHRSTLHNLHARQFVVRPAGNGPASIVEVAARPRGARLIPALRVLAAISRPGDGVNGDDVGRGE